MLCKLQTVCFKTSNPVLPTVSTDCLLLHFMFRTYTHTHTHINTHTPTFCILQSEPTTHTRMHTHTHTGCLLHFMIRTCIHTNTHTHTNLILHFMIRTYTHTHTHTAFLTDWGKSHSVSYPWISCVMIMYSLKKFFLNWKRKRKKGVGGRRLPSSGGRSNSQLHSGKKTQAEISLTILTWLGIFYHQKGFFLS